MIAFETVDPGTMQVITSLPLPSATGRLRPGETSPVVGLIIRLTAASDAIDTVKLAPSSNPASWVAAAAFSGNPPPMYMRQISAGVAAVQNAYTPGAAWYSVGYDTDELRWVWFDLETQGYGSSGNPDGIIIAEGWIRVEMKFVIPLYGASSISDFVLGARYEIT